MAQVINKLGDPGVFTAADAEVSICNCGNCCYNNDYLVDL